MIGDLNRDLRNRPIQIYAMFDKGISQFNGVSIVFSKSGAETTGHLYGKKIILNKDLTSFTKMH